MFKIAAGNYQVISQGKKNASFKSPLEEVVLLSFRKKVFSKINVHEFTKVCVCFCKQEVGVTPRSV